jgi:hypothetical protein
MSNSKDVYILQKDTPICKAGTEFISDDTVGYGYISHTNKDKDYEEYFKPENVENNPEWFKKKEEPKERVIDRTKYFRQVETSLKNNKVMIDTREDGIYIRLAGNNLRGEAFTLHWAKAFPFPELNPNTDTQVEKEEQIQQEKLFTERELLEAESKAFYAAWEVTIPSYTVPMLAKKYPTFSDYKNSQHGK